MRLYVFWSKFIFIELIPYFTILILNVFIIIKITKSARFRKRFQRHDEDFQKFQQEGEEHELENLEEMGTRSVKHKRLQTAPSSKMGSLGSSVDSSKFTDKMRVSVKHSSTIKGTSMNGRSVQKRTFLRRQQEEHKLGTILILMSGLFIICQSIKIIPDIYEVLMCQNEVGSCHLSSFEVFMPLSHLLVCVNSSTNFLIYYCNGERFRRAWLETYGCWWCCCQDDTRALEEDQNRALNGGCCRFDTTRRSGSVSSNPIGETHVQDTQVVRQTLNPGKKQRKSSSTRSTECGSDKTNSVGRDHKCSV